MTATAVYAKCADSCASATAGSDIAQHRNEERDGEQLIEKSEIKKRKEVFRSVK